MKFLLLSLLVTACSSSSPSGSVCPTADPPTYDNFGKQFFADYCQSCHSATASDRNGAPRDQNYDSEIEIRRHAEDIDLEAAAGPDATNTSMPELEGDQMTSPTDAERKRLGEYLSCIK